MRRGLRYVLAYIKEHPENPVQKRRKNATFFRKLKKKRQFLTTKMAFFEVQIIVKSCSAYKNASLYEIWCFYLFFI